MERVSPLLGSNSRVPHDRAAVLDEIDLPSRLVIDRLADEADRVDVLDLAAGAECIAGPAHRDVHVSAQIALLHVAVAGAEIAQDGAHLADVGLGLVGRAQIGLGHDLHQGNAGAVEIDQRQGRMLVVEELAGVLLEVQALDADGDALAVGHVDATTPSPTIGDLYWLI